MVLTSMEPAGEVLAYRPTRIACKIDIAQSAQPSAQQ